MGEHGAQAVRDEHGVEVTLWDGRSAEPSKPMVETLLVLG
jgi:hypothetical protein